MSRLQTGWNGLQATLMPTEHRAPRRGLWASTRWPSTVWPFGCQGKWCKWMDDDGRRDVKWWEIMGSFHLSRKSWGRNTHCRFGGGISVSEQHPNCFKPRHLAMAQKMLNIWISRATKITKRVRSCLAIIGNDEWIDRDYMILIFVAISPMATGAKWQIRHGHHKHQWKPEVLGET